MRFISESSVRLLICLLIVSSPVVGEEPDSLEMPTPTDKQATLSFDELCDGIETHRRELWALEVEYDLRTKGYGRPLVEYHFAMKGEKRLRFQTDLDPKGPAYGNAYDNVDVQIYNRDRNLASIEKQKYAWVDLDAYADGIGVAVSDQDRAQGRSLTALLELPVFQWTVQPTLEVVDGAECHVLASKAFGNRIWVDPHLDFAMRFQERFQSVKDTPQAELPLHARYFYRDFKEVAPTVYLPTKIEVVAYNDASSPKHMWNQPKFSQVMDVRKLAVGHQVQDDLFRFQFPSGTTVVDNVSNRFYRIGDSGEELDMLVGKGLEELEKSRSTTSRVLVIINIVAVVAFLAFLAYRRWGAKSRSANGK